MDENELVKRYEGFIFMAIKRLHVYWNTEEEHQEYIDSGYDGLITGIRRYDETKGFQPSTFIYKCIETEIKKRIYLNTMKKRTMRVVSLNTLLKDEELLDLIPDETNIEDEVLNKIRDKEIVDLVNSLPKEKDKKVIKMLYGIDGEKQLNLGETAKVMGVNRNAITSRRNKVLKTLLERIKRDDY